MSFIVLRTEMFERNVRVLLRGCEARVAEKFLYRPQISPPFKEMSGKGMAERMRSQLAAGWKLHACFFDEALNVSGIETSSSQADEEWGLTVIFRFNHAGSLAFGKVLRQSTSGKVAERNDALFAAFPEDSHQLPRHVEILIVQPCQFPHSQPAGIQQFQNRPIAAILQ